MKDVQTTVKITTLESGLRVITAHIPTMRSAAVGAFVQRGSRDENPDENGIAHFLEHMAFKGTTGRSALQISAQVEKLGSDINAFTTQDMTAYYVIGLDSTADCSVEVLGDICSNSLYDQEEIDCESEVICQEISCANDDAGDTAYWQYAQQAFPDQALGRCILGPSEFIRTAKRENFTSFVDRFYTTQDMIVLGAGNIEHARFVDQVNKHFRDLRTAPVAYHRQPAVWGGGYGGVTSSKFEQVTAYVGWKSVSQADSNFYAHRMLASAIGGGMSSPLFQEVREKRGLVYSVSSFMEAGPDYGSFNLNAGMTPDNLDEVLGVSMGVFNAARQSIADDDFERARNGELVSNAFARERPFSLGSAIVSGVFVSGEILDLDAEREKIMAVTKGDLYAAAEMIFKSAPSIGLAGPIGNKDYFAMLSRAV
jgi:predicted Zn-dependent peptidase